MLPVVVKLNNKYEFYEVKLGVTFNNCSLSKFLEDEKWLLIGNEKIRKGDNKIVSKIVISHNSDWFLHEEDSIAVYVGSNTDFFL